MLNLQDIFLSAAICASFVFMPSAHAERILSGYVCSQQVHKLTTEISWYKNLSKAEDAAQAQNKLILWVHMVGKIDGAT